MRKLLKTLGLILLLVLAWLGLVISEWLPRPTEDELAALAVLEADPPNVSGQRNAFAAFWLFGYDVPDAELESITAADTAAFIAEADRSRHVASFKSSAEGKYPALPSPGSNDPLLCETWGSGCLNRIRSDPEASRARLAEFRPRLEKGDRLLQYDHYRYGFVPRFDSPIAGPGALFSLQTTAAALDYLDGNVDAAFARICRDTAFWRRMRTHADVLIIDMLGVAQMSTAASLYAEMLAEQPSGFVPPCVETFSPLVDAELDQCAVLRSEFLFIKNSLHDALHSDFFGELGPGGDVAAFLVNEPHLIRAGSKLFAAQCSEVNRDRLRRRDPAPLPIEIDCDAMAWTFDPAGCMVMLSNVPSFNDYYQRALDLDARLKLLNSAIWLRSQPPEGDRAGQFAARPQALQSAAHEMTLDTDLRMLRLANLIKNRSAYWEIPYTAATATAPDASTNNDGD